MKAKIIVMPKASVRDPQGETISHSLHHMGFTHIDTLRQGKYFEVTLKEMDMPSAEKFVRSICDALLVNKVIESYHFTIDSNV